MRRKLASTNTILQLQIWINEHLKDSPLVQPMFRSHFIIVCFRDKGVNKAYLPKSCGPCHKALTVQLVVYLRYRIESYFKAIICVEILI